MAKDSEETWLDPICGLVRMKYGKTCDWRTTGCENVTKAHITGRHYTEGEEIQKSERLTGGISNISDE